MASTQYSLAEILKDYEVIDLTQVLATPETELSAGEKRVTPYPFPFAHILRLSPERGDLTTSYAILMGEHYGTHIDAPALHPKGAKVWVNEIPIEKLWGPCRVIDFSQEEDNKLIVPREIKNWEEENGKIGEDDIVLFYFGRLENFPGLSEKAADYLVQKNIKLVGCDSRGIDAWNLLHPTEDTTKQVEEPAHRVFFSNNVPIVENLVNLENLPKNGAFFLALSLKIKNGSGSPVRACALVPKK